MKIAIMTWFKYHNYGTALQASALSEYLKKLGHSVDIIDYTPQKKGDSNIHSYRFIDYIKLKMSKKEYHQTSTSVKLYEDGNAIMLYDSFLKKHTTCTEEVHNLSDLENLNCKYDAFVCGSDQIWAPNIFDSHFFLDFVYDNNKKIAYAPSIGLEKIDDPYVNKYMYENIRKFKYLSVREEKGGEIIEKLTNRKPVCAVDPTLLFSSSEWTALAGLNLKKQNSGYIAVYMLGKEQEHWNQIYKIAKYKNLSIKIIPVFEEDKFRDGCIKSPTGPKEFLEIIADADYVCTDSFHGTVFSIIFNKQFSVFERFNNHDCFNQNSRVYSILNALRLNYRIIKFHGKYIANDDINYSVINKKIQKKINISKRFLFDALTGVKEHTPLLSRHILEENILCCGCGACAYVCSKNAISINMSKEGFWKASVDEKKCIGCEKCKKICPFEGENPAVDIYKSKLFSYKDNRKKVLDKSSSGGISYAISEMLINNGYTIIGCTFDKSQRVAKHCTISKISDIKKIQGSKYLQSYLVDVIKEIELSERPIVMIGTPCQIAAIKKIFNDRDDIIYIDLICHGVPTYNLFYRYLEYVNQRYSINECDMNIEFRWKRKGWRDKHLLVSSLNRRSVCSQDKDLFYRMFENRNCYMNSCYDCRWRDGSMADIRIGDYWGPKFINDRTGVSMVESFTEKGDEILKKLSLSKKGIIYKQPLEDMLTYQQINNLPKPLFWEEVINLLSNENDLVYITDKYVFPYERGKWSKKERIKRVVRLLIYENMRRIH